MQEAFEENFRRRGELGSAVAVWRDGAPVVDLWGGFADGRRMRPWASDTVVLVFSTTKAIPFMAQFSTAAVVSCAKNGRPSYDPVVRAVLVDVGGVLIPNQWPAAAAAWAGRLGIAEDEFAEALFAGNDDHVLVGRMSEGNWWEVVRARLRITGAELEQLRLDLAGREVWDPTLVAAVRRLRPRARTAIISNTWPSLRARMRAQGLLDMVDELVLSCEVGVAKPDLRIFEIALEQLGVEPAHALFVDDTPGHVAAAEGLGMHGHVHRSAHGTIAAIDRFAGWDGPA